MLIFFSNYKPNVALVPLDDTSVSKSKRIYKHI